MFRFQMMPTMLLSAGLVLLANPPVSAQSTRSSVQTVVGQLPDDDAETRIEQVAVNPGELAAPDSRNRLMRRIERAVRRVCASDDISGLAALSAYENCHDTSLADATAQVNVLLARNGVGLVQVADAGMR